MLTHENALTIKAAVLWPGSSFSCSGPGSWFRRNATGCHGSEGGRRVGRSQRLQRRTCQHGNRKGDFDLPLQRSTAEVHVIRAACFWLKRSEVSVMQMRRFRSRFHVFDSPFFSPSRQQATSNQLRRPQMNEFKTHRRRVRWGWCSRDQAPGRSHT